MSAACGLAVGVPSAEAGYQLGQRYGADVVEFGIRRAVPLMQAGWITPKTLLTWAPRVLNPVFQAQAGAVVLGCAGVAAGLMLGAALVDC